MGKKKKQKREEKEEKKIRSKNKMKFPKIYLPEEIKNWIWGILIFIFATIFVLSFFNAAGPAGQHLKNLFLLLVGKAVYLLPVVFILGGLVFFITKYKKFYWPTVLAIFIIILGACGILEGIKPQSTPFFGGWVGYLIATPVLKFLGWRINYIFFGGLAFLGILIFWYLLKIHSVAKEQDEEKSEKKSAKEKIKTIEEVSKKPSLIKQIFSPKLKVTGLNDGIPVQESKPVESTKNFSPIELKNKGTGLKPMAFTYQAPTIELLDSGKETPTSGDIKTNSAIIKKTLQNFDIPVEMSEINIGPAVTQYTFKPAEGVKLSKITGLSNDLSLSLAAHPIRIEAPIPGRSLVGIEVPNKIRAKVRFKDLVSNPIFQTSPSVLNLALGRDVSGAPAYTDLAKMPHLLVAGSTGSGKTIFLNTLILSLIYRNSPELLNLILIDPKRVEFPVYNELPHLLAPVILDSNRAVNVLKWLISEMERRFEFLSEARARDIGSYNQEVEDKAELADLMAAKGREMEAGIVRLAQMARAVGIHLVLATQRPSVEVITGLIKANITSRVTFQVASQIDSRTIIDCSGAEKLLGQGDMLFLSSELGKPRRIQGPYISDKEVKRVVNYITSKNPRAEEFKIGDDILNNMTPEDSSGRPFGASEGEFDGNYGEDSLYEEAKRVVIESKKASASLLQRRLRIGYARAARLIDILEERGVVGPGEGAKPREVFVSNMEERGISEDNDGYKTPDPETDEENI